MKGMTRPTSMKIVALVASLFMGAIGPTQGWLLMKSMIGVQIAAYEARSGMEEILPYIIVMFSYVFVSFFAKAY